ncbi:MAG: DUF11 domain-containing protein [Anaerolineales bacterium]|nr:DUF11 domain-containing protein [Anaerolineales bacterium]
MLISLCFIIVPTIASAQGDINSDLGIFKFDNVSNGPVTPGSTIRYTVVIFNYGPDPATGVVLHETIPEHTTLVSSESPGWSCVGSICTFAAGNYSPGEPGMFRLTLKVKERLPCALQYIRNTVSVSSDTTDQDPSNNTITEETPVDASKNCFTGSFSCWEYPKYYMYTFHDNNQPATWQPYCYIISNNGFPSVESQARVCSVPGFDYEYRATHLVYAGWVSYCRGRAYYGWPDWKFEWYREEFAN